MQALSKIFLHVLIYCIFSSAASTENKQYSNLIGYVLFAITQADASKRHVVGQKRHRQQQQLHFARRSFNREL